MQTITNRDNSQPTAGEEMEPLGSQWLQSTELADKIRKSEQCEDFIFQSFGREQETCLMRLVLETSAKKEREHQSDFMYS